MLFKMSLKWGKNLEPFRMFLEIVFRIPPMYLFVFSFLAQQVASGLSNAFAGCSGLAGILSGLETHGDPTQKPMAIKRRKLAPEAALKGQPPRPAFQMVAQLFLLWLWLLVTLGSVCTLGLIRKQLLRPKLKAYQSWRPAKQLVRLAKKQQRSGI